MLRFQKASDLALNSMEMLKAMFIQSSSLSVSQVDALTPESPQIGTS